MFSFGRKHNKYFSVCLNSSNFKRLINAVIYRYRPSFKLYRDIKFRPYRPALIQISETGPV